MVVLAASIISKSGKALVSRQFVDMSRIRIEGLLAAFPKLVGSGKQHTYVETENVRYVYQPMEALYLLLVTNKQSNILEDLETLRLLSKLVPEYCPGLDEESVCKTAFELVFAFDEVISLGHKENITIAQVKQYTEMESHEERLHNLIIQSKIIATKDEMKRKASEIDKSKIDKGRMGGGGKGGFMSNSSSSNNGGRIDNGYSDLSASGGGGFGNNSSFGSLDPDFNAKSKARPTSATVPSKGLGMQLGKSQKANQFLELLKQEGEVIVDDVQVSAPGPKAAAVITDPIAIAVEEILTVTIKKDGGLESLEVTGEMALVVQKTEDAFIRVQVELGPHNNNNFNFKTHPNIDKDLWNRENILGMRDPSKAFPTGSRSGILKWRMLSKQESLVPLMINCWPSVSGGESFVNIEYEASKAFDLQNVVIQIPLPALRDAPTVNQADGEWRYDPRKSVLEWTIVLIDNTNRSGAMEFVVPPADPSSFFPIDVKFTTPKTFCDVKVVSVNQTQGGAITRYGGRTQMVVDSYQVV
ncbi:coatomer subunit delta [Marchantia polymorpha subsp. ruderalis]|uniref:Coatomer subunit delta n=2 Tax=Marchantia polymorpha TaxID=3197 RepID=A0AAF6AXH7_MARPO|nr:hypothetical protein MARPO_0022s0045 [Marchantia polymorpha]BBN04461.1 hypothetical protein Mp_3g04840 [Marchantia polymorpha subsp. ruderalis]|eukprot:PTQ43941.1 hypothetical protein MARPO_0022s0045 [Marchantia polymorpha]